MSMPHPVRRLFGALLALWFTVLTVEPARLHSCPRHGGVTNAAGAGQQATHAGHSGHAANHDSGAPANTHQCNCLGTCATAGAPLAPVTQSFDVGFAVAAGHGLPELTRALHSIAYAIPFANGPPRS